MVIDVEKLLADKQSIEQFVKDNQPYDLAKFVTDLKHSDQLIFFSKLDPVKGAQIIEHLIPELQYPILDHVDDELTKQILKYMPSDEIVDLLLAIHPSQAKILMDLLPPDYLKRIKKLMTYEPDTAGSLASVNYISARKSWTIAETLQHIRKVGHGSELFSYIYVVDTYGKLTGIISLKEILLEQPNEILGDVIKETIVSVPVTMDQEEVAEILSNYDLVALPVLSEDERMIGIITFDDLIDVIHEEATEDIHKLGGSQPLTEPYFNNSVLDVFKKRIGWLLILFVAEAYTGNVLRYFEDTLEDVIALAFFIPLLIGTGGNSGTQTVTTLVRAMAVGDVEFKDIFKVMRKEISVGLFLGFVMGVVAFLRALMLGVGFDIGSVVAVTAIFIVIWASIVAGALPLILHKLKIDPAVVSGPFIATFVDGTGLIIYFTMAKVMLSI